MRSLCAEFGVQEIVDDGYGLSKMGIDDITIRSWVTFVLKSCFLYYRFSASIAVSSRKKKVISMYNS